MTPIPTPEQALPLLQYGALGIVALMLILGFYVATQLIKVAAATSRRFADTMAEGLKNVTGTVLQAESRIHDHLEGRLKDDPDETPPRWRS